MSIETISAAKHQIEINRSKLDTLKHEYGITDWEIQFRSSFSILPNTVNWNNKKIIIRPLNIWARIKPNFPSNERAAKALAHEVKHAQQEPPSTLSLIKHGYWFDPTEREARKWAEEHWQEFKGVVKIDKK